MQRPRCTYLHHVPPTHIGLKPCHISYTLPTYASRQCKHRHTSMNVADRNSHYEARMKPNLQEKGLICQEKGRKKPINNIRLSLNQIYKRNDWCYHQKNWEERSKIKEKMRWRKRELGFLTSPVTRSREKTRKI
ncbi:hypothetical protein YC2023_065314 [Brassica napus]